MKERFEYSALGNRVEGFLQVNFEDCEGVCPFKMDFDGALYGVEGFSGLSPAPVSALCFRDLSVNDVRAKVQSIDRAASVCILSAVEASG